MWPPSSPPSSRRTRSTKPPKPLCRSTSRSQNSRTPTLSKPLPGLSTGVKPLVPGDHYSAADALLARLQLEGDAPASDDASTPADSNAPAKPASTVYTKELSDAVKHFQQRHGLVVDSKLGQGTIDALNVPLDKRVQSLNDTLERFRWLPDNYQQPRVFVNLPEFMLRAYAPDHSLDFKMEVIDGEAKGFHDTPMFNAPYALRRLPSLLEPATLHHQRRRSCRTSPRAA